MKRGEVYWLDIDSNVKNITQGRRPYLIISNDKCNESSPFIYVIPLTTARKPSIPTHVKIMFNEKINTILCENVFPVDKKYLESGRYIGCISEKEMRKISEAVKVQFEI